MCLLFWQLQDKTTLTTLIIFKFTCKLFGFMSTLLLQSLALGHFSGIDYIMQENRSNGIWCFSLVQMFFVVLLEDSISLVHLEELCKDCNFLTLCSFLVWSLSSDDTQNWVTRMRYLQDSPRLRLLWILLHLTTQCSSFFQPTRVLFPILSTQHRAYYYDSEFSWR